MRSAHTARPRARRCTRARRARSPPRRRAAAPPLRPSRRAPLPNAAPPGPCDPPCACAGIGQFHAGTSAPAKPVAPRSAGQRNAALPMWFPGGPTCTIQVNINCMAMPCKVPRADTCFKTAPPWVAGVCFTHLKQHQAHFRDESSTTAASQCMRYELHGNHDVSLCLISWRLCVGPLQRRRACWGPRAARAAPPPPPRGH